MHKQPLKERVASRKFFLAAGIIIGATLMMIAPCVANYLGESSISIMSGSEYSSLIIAIYTIYSGANIAEKRWVDLATGLPPTNQNKPPHELHARPEEKHSESGQQG